MSFDDLDKMLLKSSEREIPFYRAATGFTAIKKAAEMGVPDTPGAAMAMPTPPAGNIHVCCQMMAQLVSLKFAKQQAYIIYGTLMQSIAQDANYKDWEDHAETEQEHAQFFLRRLNAMQGEGFEIPPPPPIPPLKQPDMILNQLIFLEEQALALLTQLRATLEESDPTRFMVEQIMTEDQYHLDQLRTRLSVAPPPQAQKMAALVKAARLKKQAQGVVVPPPNMDTPEAYVAREKELQLAQTQAELAATKMQLNQTAMAAQQAAQQAQETEQALQETEMQADQAAQSAEQAAQMSQAAQQQAIDAETRAAEHATKKMQLGMRVQQMRQALAEIATQDPVTETAAGASDLAAQGAPATPEQIEEEQAAEEAAAAPPLDDEAMEEAAEAERAQADAAEQTAQAENAMAGGPAVAGPAAAPAGPGEQAAGMGAA